MNPSPWIEGITDAIGFIAGALAGYGIGLGFGFDVFAPGYETSSVVGIVLVGIGGGVGLQAARIWRAARQRGVDSETNRDR